MKCAVESSLKWQKNWREKMKKILAQVKFNPFRVPKNPLFFLWYTTHHLVILYHFLKLLMILFLISFLISFFIISFFVCFPIKKITYYIFKFFFYLFFPFFILLFQMSIGTNQSFSRTSRMCFRFGLFWHQPVLERWHLYQ